MPAVGDVDADGDLDLLIGNSSGQIHWLENTAGSGFACNFSVFHNNPFSFTTPSAEAAPQLFDLDNDSKTDLLIGMKNGRVAWYRNTTSGSALSFSLQNSTLGDIDVKGSITVYGLDGYAAPYFYSDNNGIHVLVGGVTGNIRLYDVPSDLSQPFILISASANMLNEGEQSVPYYEDINGDGKRDLLLGNASGGLCFFSSASPYVGIGESGIVPVTLFPNPAGNSFEVRGVAGTVAISVCDLMGRTVISGQVDSSQAIDVSSLPAGVYVVVIRDTSKVIAVQKLIRE
jgi:hypothetical protein